jgi:hypothetical protein
LVGNSRRELVYNKEMLLEIYDRTRDKGGMKKWV